MDQQQDITDFQTRFNGPFPFTSDGVLVGIPQAGFEEEMQTMITFQGGQIDLDTFNHENMHQWWGDNVTEGNYNLTFFKEGMATFGEYLFDARTAATAAGGLDTPAGAAAFDASLVDQFNTNYANNGLWTAAPSDPTPATLFSGRFTYTRPGTAYIALRQILGKDNFTAALQQIQRDYRHSSITETQLETEFQRLPAEPERGVPRPARPVLHPVVRHRVPARRRGEPAAAHRPWTERAGLLQSGRHLRLSLIG